MLKNLVGAFGLTVGLGVEGGREVGSAVQKVQKTFPKMSSELRSTIRDDGVRNAVVPENRVKYQEGGVSGGDGFVAGEEMDHFGETISDNEDGVEGGGYGKFDDKV